MCKVAPLARTYSIVFTSMGRRGWKEDFDPFPLAYVSQPVTGTFGTDSLTGRHICLPHGNCRRWEGYHWLPDPKLIEKQAGGSLSSEHDRQQNMEVDPYFAVRAILCKLPTDEGFRELLEQRDVASHKVHADVEAVVDQLSKIKPFYKGQTDASASEKERLMTALRTLQRDMKSKKLLLDELHAELTTAQELYELRRSAVEKRRRQLELLKNAEVTNRENWMGSIADGD